MKISEAQMAAQLAMAVAERIHAQGQKLKPEEVGIIAPFRNQVATIQSEFERALKLQKREKVVETIKSWLPNITTDTVERYQGSQRDTIIISFTAMSEAQTRSICSYDQQQTVDRKLNVALSRARQQLIMLGDAALLRQQPKYAQMLDYVQQKHGFISLELEEIANIY
jgi:DNA replication ATP-dependent helicase Dna2